MKCILLLLFLLMGYSGTFAQNKEALRAFSNYRRYYQEAREVKSPEKEKAILSFRKYYASHSYRGDGGFRKYYEDAMEKLMENGVFQDLDNPNSVDHLFAAFDRIKHISEAFRKGLLSVEKNPDVWHRCQKAILHYGNQEISRPDLPNRFLGSCFGIPQMAVNIYFSHLEQMDKVESGQCTDELLVKTCDMLKTLGLQAWTQPYRGDETDANVVSIDRFRNHVWWVGGNALSYRPLLQVAFMFSSIPMVDLLVEISSRAISSTSQVTFNDAFWSEGFTADGAGWGHGKQCLIWGYPIHGTSGALTMLETFKNTPWEKKLTSENTEALMTFFRGGNFYYYKGYILPCLDRYSMTYNPKDREIPYFGMLRLLLNKWHTSFSDADLKEMQTLSDEAQKHDIRMANYPAYNGTRWFFNNDDLIKKNNRYHLMVNMASIRCDGLESAHDFADAYNYYTADGSTWFQKRGNEYRKAFGAFDVTATPGVTAREGMDKLPPLTNWRGYCSLHNYAAAATYGGDNAVGGFIFEKMNAVDKPGVNDLTGCGRGLKHLYGVKAYKSYFLLGDYMVALGAGITNQTPGLPGHIRTTVEQTERVSEVHKLKGKGRIEWICQEGGFAYSVFPKYRKQAVLTCEQRKTDWVKMNPANKGRQPLPEQVELLQLTIDHGQSPVNASYGYAVYCGDGVPAKRYPFHVLRNDTLIQAVQNTECTVTEAMFYTEDVVLKSKGLTLSVSAPCALLLEQVEDGLVLAVTDALMNPQCTQIIVTVNGKAYICEMPQGALCGKPCVKKVKTAN